VLGFRFRLGLRLKIELEIGLGAGLGLGIGIGLGLGIGIADLSQIAINFGTNSDRRSEPNTVLILIVHRALRKGTLSLFSHVEHIDLRYTGVARSNSRIVVPTVIAFGKLVNTNV